MTDARGADWKIYVSRATLPQWRARGYVVPGSGSGHTAALGAVLEAPYFLINTVLWPLFRFAVELPWTLISGRRSLAFRVDAFSYYPEPKHYLWTTTKDHVDRVLEQVVEGLKAGEPARPLGADFKGLV